MSAPVNRADRDALTKVANQYLREEISAFVFDKRLSEIDAQTNDETVKWVRAQLWGWRADHFKAHSAERTVAVPWPARWLGSWFRSFQWFPQRLPIGSDPPSLPQPGVRIPLRWWASSR